MAAASIRPLPTVVVVETPEDGGDSILPLAGPLGRCFGLVAAKITHRSNGTVRFAGFADIAPMQDQPVVGVTPAVCGHDLLQHLLNGQRRVAGR